MAKLLTYFSVHPLRSAWATLKQVCKPLWQCAEKWRLPRHSTTYWRHWKRCTRKGQRTEILVGSTRCSPMSRAVSRTIQTFPRTNQFDSPTFGKLAEVIGISITWFAVLCLACFVVDDCLHLPELPNDIFDHGALFDSPNSYAASSSSPLCFCALTSASFMHKFNLDSSESSSIQTHQGSISVHFDPSLFTAPDTF